MPVGQIVAAYQTRYSLRPEQAHADVQLTLHPVVAESKPATSEFRYEPDKDGYTFYYQGVPALHACADGSVLKRLPSRGIPNAILPSLVRAIAPKLLALRGETVLHASAVRLESSAVAFSGVSGSGKTTTARAWASGGTLVCEDQMLLRIHADSVLVATEAEQIVGHWVRSAAAQLISDDEVRCDGLAEVKSSELVPLLEIGFINGDEDRTVDYHAVPLPRWRTAGLTFRNAFYGADRSSEWPIRLEIAASIGRLVTGFQIRLPQGLDRLLELARRAAPLQTLRA